MPLPVLSVLVIALIYALVGMTLLLRSRDR